MSSGDLEFYVQELLHEKSCGGVLIMALAHSASPGGFSYSDLFVADVAAVAPCPNYPVS